MAEHAGPLAGKVALVTGASRGVGKGIALGLAEAGATIYVTGRTVESGKRRLAGTIHETVEEIGRRGGRGIAVQCDHGDDAQVEALFRRVHEEVGALDVLVNNVFAVPSGPLFGTPFWEQPIEMWDTMHTVGLRSHYVAAVHAVPPMVERGRGLIVNVSSYGAKVYAVSVAYGVGKAGVDRLTADMAHELHAHGVTVLSLCPGVVRTERILAMGDAVPFEMSEAESPVLSGRVVAALAADPKVHEQTGKVVVVRRAKEAYGLEDEPEG